MSQGQYDDDKPRVHCRTRVAQLWWTPLGLMCWDCRDLPLQLEKVVVNPGLKTESIFCVRVQQ